MKIDFLNVEGKTKAEQDAKKEEFIARLKAAIKKSENKEKLENGKKSKKGVKSSKANK